jgi:hypothetical protein
MVTHPEESLELRHRPMGLAFQTIMVVFMGVILLAAEQGRSFLGG